MKKNNSRIIKYLIKGVQQEISSLKEYLGFRHLFRNIYGMELKWDKLKILLIEIRDDIWKRFKVETNLFMNRLKETIN